MAEKKGKELALELIDDLLNEKSEIVELKDEPNRKAPLAHGTIVQPPSSAVKASAKTPPPHKLPDDATIDIGADKTEVSQDRPMPARGEEDRTVPLNSNNNNATTLVSPQAQSGEERARTSVGRPGAFRSLGAPTATEAALAQSESLRIAQSRILELENELERLRLQNEELAAAGETLRRRADELLTENSQREQDYAHALSTFEQEKHILTNTKEALQREIELLRRKGEELELRISNSVQKIRVRERELENRLELVKMESAALIRAKDEMILDLKRQMDQLNLELNNYRTKNQELNRLSNDKQEQLRRTVKALRLALSMLEGEEEASPVKVRKVK
ncbi:MAG: hypothetical protein KF799_14265 [Bdellovibrionales bacterium]|nr:hypothetical protein [Bdellovibrionales bacterium]